jgi:hypothetical protein
MDPGLMQRNRIQKVPPRNSLVLITPLNLGGAHLPLPYAPFFAPDATSAKRGARLHAASFRRNNWIVKRSLRRFGLTANTRTSCWRRHLEAFFQHIAPEGEGRYRHNDEGADDMPAHIRTALNGVNLSIPVIDRRLALGTWQGIYLFEDRRAPRERDIVLHLIGE